MKRKMQPSSVSSSYKGVIPQYTGKWGAQIYYKNNRYWLGTFNSEIEAAMAYDSASFKLHKNNNNPFRNLSSPLISPFLEKKFQIQFSDEEVIGMIRDGTYNSKLSQFISGEQQQREMEVLRIGVGYGPRRIKMFEKVLTESDVGKLRRLVVPKKHAVRYFPQVGNGNGNEDEELVFVDDMMKVWRFRYCYWKSSQSYVFTKGWNKFVKDKGLKAEDTLVFFACECECDCHHQEEEEVVMTRSNKLVYVIEVRAAGNNSTTVRGDDGVVMNVEEEGQKKNKGFRLFGVDIINT